MPEDYTTIEYILLVDDDEDDCHAFAEALAQVAPDIEIITLQNSEGLLKQVELREPHLLFLDINMPRVTGFDCLKALQQNLRFSKIPVIMYSHSPNPKDINIAYGLGAILYVRKPNTVPQLSEALKQLLHLNWHQAGSISDTHFSGGNYRAFEVSLS